MTMGFGVVFALCFLLGFFGLVLLGIAIFGNEMSDDDERCVAGISGVGLIAVTCYIFNWAVSL